MTGILYDLFLSPFEALSLAKKRDELLSRTSGRVLEIGAGTGLNFRHYPSGAEITATDPDEGMRHRALSRAKVLKNVHVQAADAENLPFPDASFDTVASTLTFCSIEHPEKALAEAYRVLKPGGKMLMMEHVRKNTRVAGRLQDWLTPAWKRIAGGCHLNRSPEKWVSRTGFRVASRRLIWGGYGELWVLEK